MTTVETLTGLEAVRALVPEWRELLADSSTDEVTLSPEWLLTWWGVFAPGSDRRLRFLAVRQEGRLVGLAPLLRRRHWHYRCLPFRRLEPLASGEPSDDAICSDYLGVIARRGCEAAVARAVVGALRGWDELVIPLMNGEAPMAELLDESARQAGLFATITETTVAPYIPLPRTWDAYLKQLARKERYLVNRTLRDFEAWAGSEWRLVEATATTLDEGRNVLHSLHQERWDGHGPGVFRSQQFRAFHDSVMPLLLERDALELLWLTLRGGPVAAMYNIRWGGKTSFYQCGRSMNVPQSIRPGGVILYMAIRRAIERGQREFDFLGGEALYKKQLALASRPLVELRLERPSPLEGVRGLIERGKEAVRPLWRGLRAASALRGRLQ